MAQIHKEQTSAADVIAASVHRPDFQSELESVRDLIDRQAKDYPERIFLIDPHTGVELSYVQLQQQLRAIARYIDNETAGPGASIAYAMTNDHCCVVSVLGIMYGGYRAVAINLVAGRDVIAYVLAHSQSMLVLTRNEHSALIEEALHCSAFADENAIVDEDPSKMANQDHIDDSEAHQDHNDNPAETGSTDSSQLASTLELETVGRSRAKISLPKPSVKAVDLQLIQEWADRRGAHSFHSTEATDDALLMYTSGTTGRPKGVTLSHSNVIAGGRNVVTGHQLTSKDRALCVLPLYHINGLCVTVFAPLLTSGSLVLPQRFSTRAFWQLVDDYRCSWFSVVPTQIAYLLRDADNSEQPAVDRSYLRFGRSASAPLSPDVHKAFEERFNLPIIETMGLTETAAQILTNPLPPARRKPGSPGLPVGDEVIIADQHLNALPANQEGELLVRGANVMQRYFRDETATRQALVTGGWLRTGDLGRKDQEGYLFITGRLKELIIKGGENIAPREIDDALYQHSDVVEAAAFARPCDDFGQRVEAAVVIRQDSSLSEQELVQLCSERVGQFKCPDRIHFLNELPKGPSGKIQRAKILEVISELAS